MTEFTPLSGAAGGLLIGLAAAILLLACGRVAGISGILGQAIWPAKGEERGWRLAFLAGLPLGAALVALVSGPLAVRIDAAPATLIVAGLLVGFGTRLGNGCTSGHGICGLGRGSTRSAAATIIFMAVAGVTVFVVRHLLPRLLGAFA
jgi:uncharacterized membrane protein YedE/YeeE